MQTYARQFAINLAVSEHPLPLLDESSTLALSHRGSFA